MSLSIVFSAREIDSRFIEHIRGTVGVKGAEIIPYLNKGEFSLVELYNKGLEEAKNDVIVFMHDDIIFNNHNWGRALLKQFENTEYGILGIAGKTDLSTDYDEVNCWSWSVGRLKHQINGKLINTFISNRYEYPIQVVCLDGVFLVVHRNRIRQKFDIRFKGFHFYDISFTFSNHLYGVKVGVTFDVDLTHKSGGSYNQEWHQNRLLFLQIYKDSLPCRIRPDKIEYNPSLIRKFNPGNSLISIIIPAKDRAELVIDCIQSIIDRTRIARYEIIVAESEFTEENKRTLSGWTSGLGRKANFSRIDILEYDHCNLARTINDIVKNHLSRESNYILFYDSKIKLINDAIDRCLLLFREKKSVGTVGIRLHYDDNSIRHDGVKPLFGCNNIFDIHYQNLGSCYMYNPDTVEIFGNTMDFLMVDRLIFEKVYLNENYNELPDIELNLQMIRLDRKNYHIGHAVAYYYGSQTREENPDNTKKTMDDYHNHLLPFFKKHCVPIFFTQLFEGASQASQAGRHQTAVEMGKLLLEHAPQNPNVHHLVGFIHGRGGDQTMAVKHFRQAIALNGQMPSYHYNLAEALYQQGEWKPAEQSYRQTLNLDPRHARACRKLAEVLYNQGQLEEAIKHYSQAIRLVPNDTEAHYKLGWALQGLGAYELAVDCYRQALQLKPDLAEAYNDLGVALDSLKRYAEANQAFQKAVQYNPDLFFPHKNLGRVLEKQGQLKQAQDCFRQALALNPDDAELRVYTESLCPPISSSNAEIDAYRANLTAQLAQWRANDGLKPNISQLHLSTATPPFSMTYHGRDDRPLKEAWAALFQGKLLEMPPSPITGKPHIGFLVTENHEGAFIRAMTGMLNCLNGERFRLTVVCCGQRGEQLLRNAIHHPAIHYLPVPLRFDRCLETIGQAGFHLLYHWEVGTDSANYFLPFFRLAPVQCTGWGWPVTSGIPQMNYYLSCQYLERPDGDGDYSERLVRFQRLPAYFERPQPLPVPSERDRFGLSASQHLYLCAQNLRKIQPDFDELLGGVLRRDPRGVAVLVEDSQPAVTAALRQRWQTHLPDVLERVRFLPRLAYADYLRLLAATDVALDTLHFGGGITTYETLGMGVPIVTLPTAFARGRYAYAAYRQMGLEEGIATDPQDYVERALRFASEPDYRAVFSARLREASAALFEDHAAVREFEDFLEAAVAEGG
ncbi:MAG: tetratricopeptide repeat protein [Candidatus Contendobacter sp.]|nr:tetratricopeptide repeat protein [Candidatus Contendobacter sp.]